MQLYIMNIKIKMSCRKISRPLCCRYDRYWEWEDIKEDFEWRLQRTVTVGGFLFLLHLEKFIMQDVFVLSSWTQKQQNKIKAAALQYI